MRITLYAEHGADWPLWGPRGLLDEAALPLSQSTKLRLKAWLYAYDGRREEIPAWRPPVGTVGPVDEEDAWVEEGERLRELVQEELGAEYQVSLES